MEHKLPSEPVFEFDAFRANTASWKANGASQVTIEWGTGPGPTIFCYPDLSRQLGMKWTTAVPVSSYNELYADYLEYTLAPKLVEIAAARGLATRIICADQQPLLVMRMRRREIEQASHSAATL